MKYCKTCSTIINNIQYRHDDAMSQFKKIKYNDLVFIDAKVNLSTNLVEGVYRFIGTHPVRKGILVYKYDKNGEDIILLHLNTINKIYFNEANFVDPLYDLLETVKKYCFMERLYMLMHLRLATQSIPMKYREKEILSRFFRL